MKTTADPTASLRTLVERFAESIATNSVGEKAIHETHISIVLVVDEFAYKFKKAVDLGFLDFSTLDRRRHFCERELEFNQRYAPDLYIDVVPITGSAASPRMGNGGTVIEYAVRMRRFAADATLDVEVENDRITENDITAFGRTLATIHEQAPVASITTGYGDVDLVTAQVDNAFEHLSDIPEAAQMRQIIRAMTDDCRAALASRQSEGHVRDCHGDLHLSNIVRLESGLYPFDCIEFDDQLRFIDTVSDMAFVLMDLDVRGRHDLANAFLNAYLDASGDFAGLNVLHLYAIYRSVVRAKVAHLQSLQASDSDHLRARRNTHLSLAASYLDSELPPGLIITHGVSASGKSYISRDLARRYGYIHLRSDVERKRLAGLAPNADSGSGRGSGIYSEDFSDQTYRRLLDLACSALANGYSVIVDATFLERRWRDAFRQMAHAAGQPFHIVHCEQDDAVLRARLARRRTEGDSISEATPEVLAWQIASGDALADDELEWCVGAEHAKGELDPGRWGRRRI